MSRQLAPASTVKLEPNQYGNNNGNGSSEQQNEQQALPISEAEVVGYREQDRFLPLNNLTRIMKHSLPETSKISKDAKECIQECTSEFISFITSEAAEKAAHEKRKTITGDDVLNALKTLGFDEYGEVLLIYLAKYRELQRSEPARKRNRKSAGAGGASNGSAELGQADVEDDNGNGTGAGQENGHETGVYGDDSLDGHTNPYAYTYDDGPSAGLLHDDNEPPFGLDLDALESDPEHN